MHTRIARMVSLQGCKEFSPGPIHFAGGHSKDLQDELQFRSHSVGLQSDQGLLTKPYLLDIDLLGFPYYTITILWDQLNWGALEASWNLYAFGSFDLPAFREILSNKPPNTMEDRYFECGLNAIDDAIGFRQVFDIPGSIGSEIRFCDNDGYWSFSRHTAMAPTSVPNTDEHARRWPMLPSTRTAPSVGERSAILGGLSRFRHIWAS